MENGDDFFLPKLIKCTIPRMNSNVIYANWVITMQWLTDAGLSVVTNVHSGGRR